MNFASVNGTIVPAEEARVSVLDNGFAFGDSVYEVMRTYGGRLFEPGRHFRRLRASAARLGLRGPATPTRSCSARSRRSSPAPAPASRTCASSCRAASATARYDFTRIAGPTVVMIQKPLPRVSRASLRRGHPPRRRRRPPQPPEGARSRDQVEQPAQQHPRGARGAGARLRRAAAAEPGGLPGRGREHQPVHRLGGDLPDAAALRGHPARDHARGRDRARSPGSALPATRSRSTSTTLLGADEAFMTSTTREVVPVRPGGRRADRRRPAGALHLPA